jgi:hypothetical protein
VDEEEWVSWLQLTMMFTMKEMLCRCAFSPCLLMYDGAGDDEDAVVICCNDILVWMAQCCGRPEDGSQRSPDFVGWVSSCWRSRFHIIAGIFMIILWCWYLTSTVFIILEG